MDLAQSIEQYYLQRYKTLENSKQFHFASRLAAWDGNKNARELLATQLHHLLPSRDTPAVRHLLKELLQKQPKSIRIGRELREPYLQKYPDLYGLQLAIFRVRHLKCVYGIDISTELYSLYPLNEIDALKHDLLEDKDALRFLSTHAVSPCYLIDIVLREQEPDFDIQRLYALGSGYDLSDKTQLQLLLYLYTHCIISATNFYTRPLVQSLDIYRQMLRDMDAIIGDQYDNINLDNKLEFLVCARVCSFQSKSEQRIYNECGKSLSNEGVFIVDKLNNNGDPDRQTFKKSEHRNTLFIMSTRPFKPCSDLIVPAGHA
jgi:hypothetical protein